MSFQYHNLVQRPFPSLVHNLFAFDLIVCRNVMIYLSAEIMCRVISQFRDCLEDGGWLAVGHAELNADFFREFRTVNFDSAVLYQRSRQPSIPAAWARPAVSWGNPPTPPPGMAAGWVPHDLPLDDPGLPNLPKTGFPAAPASGRNKAILGPDSSVVLTLADLRAQIDCGNWDAAANCCRQLLATGRLNPLVHFYHALVLEHTASHVQAEQALRQAIYLDRKHVLAHYYLGMLLQRSRDAAGAQRCFRNVVRLLEPLDESHVFADADGLTVGAMRQLTCMHLHMLREFQPMNERVKA